MNCSKCNYLKDISVFTKCSGVTGRTKVGTSYYCSHPDIDDPVPVVKDGLCALDGCPLVRQPQDTNT